MLKMMAILAFLTVTINPVQKNQTPNQPNNHCDDKPAPTVSVVSDRTCCPKQGSPKDEPPWWKQPEWWLFIIGLPTIGIIGWQARAAKVATDAIMLSERAWLLPDGEKIGMPTLIPSDSPTNPRKFPVTCGIALRNSGNTPATAIDWEFELRIGPSHELPPSFEIYEKEPPKDRQTPFPIGPGWPGHAHAVLRPQEYISTAEKAEIDSGAKHVWLCGIARYRDVFEHHIFLRKRANLHETKVCLRYVARSDGSTGMWVLGGPSGYNSAE